MSSFAFARSLALIQGSPAVLTNPLTIENRSDAPMAEATLAKRTHAIDLHGLWESDAHIYEAVVVPHHLNPTGTLFGGNTLHWLHVASRAFIQGRIPNIRDEDIATVHGSTKFSLPAFAGDNLRIFAEYLRSDTASREVTIQTRMLRSHEQRIENIASAFFTFTLAEARQVAPSSRCVAEGIRSYKASPSSAVPTNGNFGEFFSWLDLAVGQAAHAFALERAAAQGARTPLVGHFATRHFDVSFSPFGPGNTEPSLFTRVIPDARRNFDYTVEWRLGPEDAPGVASGTARVIDIGARHEPSLHG